ncbi:protein of unknown function [Alkalibacterium subtropicum]|uniref:DUF4153 domain-containing protein n=1 Tax=Alkalibacterium subtropicum TaxID=753702 RepID=A0A1I1KAU4_9LACT|nr:DUF4153 domain-containing protein [Alkalibacterium subtropicum]SFC57442.1 protein of unknown function [Alkalibacterium subtropicum]
MSVKNWFMKRKTQWLATFSRFPLATALLALIVLFTILTIRSEGDSDYMNQALSAGLGVLALVSIQLVSEIKPLSKAILWGSKLSSLILSLLYYVYLRQAPMGFNQSGQVRTMVLYFTLAVLLIALPTLHQRLLFSDSLIIFIKAVFSSLLISVILFMGISAIFSAYTTLIYELDYRWFAYSAAIVFEFIAPVYFLSRLPHFKETELTEAVKEAKSIPPLLEILIAYIIIPVLLVFSAILIAYILTNISGDFWQDNLMEPMLISYTIAGILTLFLAEHVDKKIAQLFSRFYPYLLLVIAIFQTVSSSLKTADFGLTHGRYFVLLFGIFSIVSTLIYSFLTSQKRVIPFLLIGLGVISILPVIDAVSIGIRNQASNIDELVAPYVNEDGVVTPLDTELTNEEKARFSYSMNYLNQQEQLDRLDWLPEDFSYYQDFQNTFGFDSSYHYYYAEDREVPGTSGPRYAFISLDMTEPLVFSTEGIDEIVEVTTFQLNDREIPLNQDPYRLELNSKDEDLTIVLLENETVLLEQDLSELIDSAWDQNRMNPERPLSEMQLTTEDDNSRLTVIVKRLEIQENEFMDGEFIILISYD